MSPRSHSTSWIAAASAYSSTSQVDSATVRCFLLAQLTGSPLSFATQPVTDLRSHLLFAQSASANAHTSTRICACPRELLTTPPLRRNGPSADDEHARALAPDFCEISSP